MQPIGDVQHRFLTELDRVLRSRQDEQERRPVKYSQSCRQATDLLPFDYFRPLSPSLTIPELNSSEANSLEPICIRTNKYSNATLLRKARLGQLRDDTAILYWVKEIVRSLSICVLLNERHYFVFFWIFANTTDYFSMNACWRSRSIVADRLDLALHRRRSSRKGFLLLSIIHANPWHFICYSIGFYLESEYRYSCSALEYLLM